MRIEVRVEDRVGITHRVLGVLAQADIDLAAVESVEIPNEQPPLHRICIDAPALRESDLPALRTAIMALGGIHEVRCIGVMPAERREIHLRTLLAAIPDPVMVIDAEGVVIFKNTQAERAAGEILPGQPVTRLFDEPPPTSAFVNPDPLRQYTEVTLGEEAYLMESWPIQTDNGDSLGAFLRLQPPTRVGARLSSWQKRLDNSFDDIIGVCAAMRQAKAQAKRFAELDLPVLLSGETGTGKELFARALHESGPRHQAPFLALNCAALPESLAESELFGYSAGAFSGASRGGKPGLLELADKGTVFLDEIGEMTPYLQAKLLRFVQDGTFRRVGGKDERKVDVRIISATHRDLKQMAEQGDFREDLWYRLNVLSLELPPLRDRREDIPLLLQHFIATACQRIGREPVMLTEAALAHLQAVPWQGNIRQLENSVFRLTSLAEGRLIDLDQVIETVGPADAVAPNQVPSWAAAVAEFERHLLGELYPQYSSSRKLAKRLGISHTAVADKLRKYGIGKD